MTRRGKIIALGFVLLIGVLVSLPFVWRYQGKRELQRTIESLQARGEKLTVKELVPPRPPDAENGFPGLLPIISRLPTVNLPVAPFVAPGKLMVVTKVTSWTNYSSQTIETWDDAEVWLESSRPVLEQARRELEKPAFHAGRNYSQGFNIRMPDLSQWKKLTIGFKLAALQEARAGNRREALDNLRAGLRVGSVLHDDPLLISQLVRIACDTIMLDTVWHCLHALDWTETELAEIQAMLPRGHIDGMVRALDMERVMGRSAADWLRRSGDNVLNLMSFGPASSGPTNLSEFMDMAVNQPGELFLTRPMGEFWRFAHLDASESHYLLTLQGMIDNIRAAAAKKSMAELDLDFTGRLISAMSPGERFRYLLSSLMLPALEKAALKGLKAETHRSLTEAALALHRYHRRNGNWPESLIDLVPEYLAAVTIDYSDGRPLRYRRQSDGRFLLYSIGEPRQLEETSDSIGPIDTSVSDFFEAPVPAKFAAPVDEGGAPTPYQTNRTFANIWAGRDVVWPWPATKEEIKAFEEKRRKQDDEEQ